MHLWLGLGWFGLEDIIPVDVLDFIGLGFFVVEWGRLEGLLGVDEKFNDLNCKSDTYLSSWRDHESISMLPF